MSSPSPHDKKILFLCKYIGSSELGIPGQRVKTMCRILSTMDNEVKLIYSDPRTIEAKRKMDGEHNFEAEGKLQLLQVKSRSFRKSYSLARVISWIEFEFQCLRNYKINGSKPDVVIISIPPPTTMITGILIKIFARSKLIVEVRDIWPLTLVTYKKFSVFNPTIVFLRILEKLTYLLADLIVGLMPNLREHVGQDSKWESKVAYIPIPYEQSVMQQSKIRSDWPENLSALREEFVVGYFGKISRSNSLETLLEAFSKIDDEIGVHALLVGDGDEKEHLMKKYSNLKNVTWHDRVSKEDCIALETACDVLYFSTRKNSVFRFGQSLNKLVEYMTVGRPIIASYSGYKNMINEANCGMFVDAENSNALASIILQWSNKSRDELDAIGGRGRVWIQKNRDVYNIVNVLNKKIRTLRN